MIPLRSLWILLFLGFLSLSPAFAGNAKDAKDNDDRGEILREEAKHLYQAIPDIKVIVDDLGPQKLSTFWEDKPLLLSFFYKTCIGSCRPFLVSLKNTVDGVGGLGEDYRMLSLSFDPKDSLEDVQRFAKSLLIPEGEDWQVGIADPQEMRRLLDALGFWYENTADPGQFDHPSMLAWIDKGVVRRVLLGNVVIKPRFLELYAEIRGKFISMYMQPGDDTAFRCVDIDEETGEVRLSFGVFLMILPALMSILVAALIFSKRKEDPEEA